MPTKDTIDTDSSTMFDTFEPWSSKKSLILNRYVTTKKISMTTVMNTSNDDSIIDNTKGIRKAHKHK